MTAVVHLAGEADEWGQRCAWCRAEIARVVPGWPEGALILEVPHPDGAPGYQREVLTYDDEPVHGCDPPGLVAG